MHSFEIAAHENFPSNLGGILVPDDGHRVHFHDVIGNYYGCEDPLIALFVSESVTSLAVPLLDNPELINLAAVVTFGNQSASVNRIGQRTHLQTVASELRVPFMQLVIPDTYPTLTSGLNPEDPYFKTWVDNNPIKELYKKHVSLIRDGTTATFEPLSYSPLQ